MAAATFLRPPFAPCVGACRRCHVEVLIPDFKGNWDALAEVVEARPDVLNHNLESIARLYDRVRPQAKYERSLELLARTKQLDPAMTTKSGIMVGLGEEMDELLATLRDLRRSQCDLVTIGQYLRPSPKHLPVVRYYPPEDFAELKRQGEAMGFAHVASGPLVRSSYHAADQAISGTAERTLMSHLAALLEAEVFARVEKPSRYLGCEWNTVHKDLAEVDVRMALAFPDLYDLGLSNLGLLILYSILNRQPGVWAERAYMPALDLEAQLVAHNLPLV